MLARKLQQILPLIIIARFVTFINYSTTSFLLAWPRVVPREITNTPVTCLHGPRFLVAWNIYISCNLPCATRAIAMHRIAVHRIAVHGIAMRKVATL